MNPFRPKIGLIIILAVVVAACQSVPKTTTTEVPEAGLADIDDAALLTETQKELIRAFSLETDEQWMQAALAYQELAEKITQPERSAYFINAALMLYNAERHRYIEVYFESLQETDILPQDQENKATLLAGSYFGIGKIYQSLANLPDIEAISDYRFKALALKIRAMGVLAIGKPMESMRLRIQIGQFLKTDKAIENNHQFIWEALNRLSERTIIKALSERLTANMRGWFELNLIARRSNMLPAKIEPWVSQWYKLYGDHAAGKYFAINLLEDSKRIYIKPRKIALMLPFSGRLEKVSQAVQKGFMYAYYQDRDSAPELEVINASTDPAEFNIQYQKAIQDGADFIVGPISKDLIGYLQNREKTEVPTLALNYAEETREAMLNLYQFGLRPEDEAEQIADLALAEGRNHAVTLVPDTDWGARLQRAFTERFEMLGGRVVGAEVYPSKKNDYSAAIKKLLNLTSSEQRRTLIQQTIGQKTSFESRRRQDVDMVFIAANPRQARLIKPQLKFYRAQTLPVYATSHISSGSGNPDDDRDLDGILFVDIPWMLDNAQNRDFRQVSKLWPDFSKRFSRLFALGIDAYRMIPSLRRLMIHPGESELLNTGRLTVDKNGHVKRALLMATYEKGVARLLQQPLETVNPVSELQ
ncbi:MAG: penicillin-binding protein activator [Proteobacteria bacterium]|nr:penicillin-binding protein activator [Pseudomonadota bacterium]